jgi:Outer membrane protein beta-barrel domain
MSKFIESSESAVGWSGSYFSRVARRALTVAAVVGAGVGVGMMSAQSNFAASGASDTSGPGYSSSAAEQTDALVVAPLPDFSKMIVGAGGGHAQSGARPGYRPNYTNEDDSFKFTAYGGAGATVPIANTSNYLTPNFSIQLGVGPRFTRAISVPLEFDWDQFGFTKGALDNQIAIYDFLFGGNTVKYLLDGNSHIWSFSVQPTYTIHTGSTVEAYVKVGFGFYHKVANFTLPTAQFVCYYYCGIYYANYNLDHYTSNAPGFDAGVGFTYKFSPDTHARLYVEMRYVFINNKYRPGIVNTPASLATVTNSTTNFYPANSNQTDYLPLTVGIRF